MAYADLLRASAPVGLWPLSEASGSVANDISGNAQHGSYNGVTLGTASLLPGTGLTSATFAAATSQHVLIPDTASLSPMQGASGTMTLEAIIQPTSALTGSEMLMSKYGAFAYEFYWFLAADGNVGFIPIQAGGATIVGNAYSGVGSVALNTRYHLAVTYDRAAPAISHFINGVKVSTTTTGFSGNASDTASPLRIGLANGDGSPYNGLMSHAAMFPTVLSDAVIAIHANESLRGGVSY